MPVLSHRLGLIFLHTDIIFRTVFPDASSMFVTESEGPGFMSSQAKRTGYSCGIAYIQGPRCMNRVTCPTVPML
jgi:hypothetical protein